MSLAVELPPLKLTTHAHLSTRLLLATLTGTPIRISQIRSSSPTHPGLAPHEVSLLRLLDTVTNGSHIELSVTGTTLLYKPGLIVGCAAGYGAASAGGVVTHELPVDNTRGVSYFLIPLALLAPFAKAGVNVIFSGPGVITSATETGDVSVDTVRTAVLPLLARFGVERNVELRILRRSGVGPNGKGGGGEVQLICNHQVRLPKTLHLLGAGRVKRIRGVAYAVGVAGANNGRMIEAARGILNRFVPDTYIFSDTSSAPVVAGFVRSDPAAKKKVGVGFGLSLVAETSSGVLYESDAASGHQGGITPEEIGKRAAFQLLEKIHEGGCATRLGAKVMLIMMAMGSEDVGRLQLGREVVGSEEIIALGRDLRAFGASGWGLRDATTSVVDREDDDEEDEEEEDDRHKNIVVSVKGRGIGNVGKKAA